MSLSCGLVILNYKNFTVTRKLLDAVKDFPELDYIVVVDNNSPNDSYERLKEYQSDKISVLQSGKNGGYSYGNNFGAKYLIENYNPDIIAVANPDVLFDNHFVLRIKKAFAANSDYAVLTGIQLRPDGTIGAHPFWEDCYTLKSMIAPLSYMAFVDPVKRFLTKIFHIRFKERQDNNLLYMNYVNEIINSPEALNEVWTVEGSLFFIRTKDFEAIGLFDEKIFMFFEEDVLAAKIHKLGRKIGVLNDITYTHFHDYSKVSQDMFRLTMIEKGRIVYFNNYISRNIILQIFHAFLVRLVHFEERFFPRLSKKIFHRLKRKPM